MPIKSEKQVLLEQFGVVIKKLILDDREDSEDFDEFIELTEALQFNRSFAIEESMFPRQLPSSTSSGISLMINFDWSLV